MIPAAGDILNQRYRVLGTQGKGGMGTIFLAEDLRLEGRKCALKQVSGDPRATPDAQRQARAQFYQEASVLARLDHPVLPKVSDFFSLGDTELLVMDYVAGVDLRQRIETARAAGTLIPELLVLDWARQLLDALVYLHAQQPTVVHRDIKPANIRLTPAGTIKLVDFGLVKLLVPNDGTITVVQGRGTIHYTPLEQYGGDTGHTDGRTDVYGLAATLYHLLTNTPPTEAKVRFLQTDSLVPVRDINPALSARTERALHWALHLHPEDRPPTIADFRGALLDGIFPGPQGQPEFVPATAWEWAQLAFTDPLERHLSIAALVIIGVGVIATLAT
jgi:serine/threonine-protein kinase